MINNIFNKLKLILLTTFLLVSYSYSYANVYATLDRDTVGNGESLELTIHLDSFSQQPNLNVLDKDFTVYNATTTNKTSIKNGKRISSYEMVVTMMPNRSGDITVPAIPVGQQSTQTMTLNVQKSLSSTEATKYQDIFALGTISSDSTYVNVPVTYTVRIYYATPLLGIQPKKWEIPKASLSQIGTVRSYKKRINGKSYDISEESFLVVPSSTGTIRIPPIVLQATTGNSFGQLGVKNQYISTEGHTLYVKPIPGDISIKDWFPSTGVKLTDSWSQQTNIKAGNMITRTVMVAAGGVLGNDIPKLEFESSDDFNVYVEKPEIEDMSTNGEASSTAVYKIGYMPLKEGKAYVPDVTLKWFDTTTGKSKVAKIGGKIFKVAKGDAPAGILNLGHQNTATIDRTVIVESPFWRNIAIGFILIWLVTLIVLMRVIFRNNEGPTKTVTDDVQLGDKASIRDIKKACSKKDNAALRKSLINWANTEYKVNVVSLIDIADMVPDMKPLLRELNSAIYSNTTFNNYRDIFKTARDSRKTKNHKNTKSVIKGLYDK